MVSMTYKQIRMEEKKRAKCPHRSRSKVKVMLNVFLGILGAIHSEKTYGEKNILLG